MHQYRIHTLESAPEESRAALQGLEQAVGLIPNLAATMAELPTLVNGFVGPFGNFHGGSFSGPQKQVLLLTNAVTNTCAWAIAFHSTLALKEVSMPTMLAQFAKGGCRGTLNSPRSPASRER